MTQNQWRSKFSDTLVDILSQCRTHVWARVWSQSHRNDHQLRCRRTVCKERNWWRCLVIHKNTAVSNQLLIMVPWTWAQSSTGSYQEASGSLWQKSGVGWVGLSSLKQHWVCVLVHLRCRSSCREHKQKPSSGTYLPDWHLGPDPCQSYCCENKDIFDSVRHSKWIMWQSIDFLLNFRQ